MITPIEAVDIVQYSERLKSETEVDLSQLWRDLSQMLAAVKAEAVVRGWIKDPDEIPVHLWGGKPN